MAKLFKEDLYHIFWHGAEYVNNKFTRKKFTIEDSVTIGRYEAKLHELKYKGNVVARYEPTIKMVFIVVDRVSWCELNSANPNHSSNPENYDRIIPVNAYDIHSSFNCLIHQIKEILTSYASFVERFINGNHYGNYQYSYYYTLQQCQDLKYYVEAIEKLYTKDVHVNFDIKREWILYPVIYKGYSNVKRSKMVLNLSLNDLRDTTKLFVWTREQKIKMLKTHFRELNLRNESKIVGRNRRVVATTHINNTVSKSNDVGFIIKQIRELKNYLTELAKIKSSKGLIKIAKDVNKLNETRKRLDEIRLEFFRNEYLPEELEYNSITSKVDDNIEIPTMVKASWVNELVKTSRLATITQEQAKIVYMDFKRFLETGESKLLGQKVGMFTFNGYKLNKKFTYYELSEQTGNKIASAFTMEWAAIIGCHTIFMSEMDKCFLHFKLYEKWNLPKELAMNN